MLLIFSFSWCFKTQEVIDTPNTNTEEESGEVEEFTDFRSDSSYSDLKKLRKEWKSKEAMDLIETKLLLYPNDENLLTQLGLLHIDDNDYEKAISTFEDVLLKNKNNISANLNTALAYYKMWELDKYEEYVSIAQEINPNSEQISSFISGIDSEPEAEGSAPNQVDKTFFVLDKKLAPIRLYLENKEDQKAYDELVIISNEYENNSEIKKLLADSLLGLKEYDEAIKMYEDLLVDWEDKDFDVLFWLAVGYYSVGTRDDAKQKLDEAFELASEEEKIVINRFIADLNIENGNLPEVPTFNIDYVEWTEIYNVIELELDEINTLYNEERYEEVEKLLITLNAKHPNNPNLLFWLWRIHLEQKEDFPTALSYYKASYDLEPEDVYTLEWLFWSSVRTWEIENAVEYFNEAQLLPGKFESHQFAEDIVSESRNNN